MSSKDIVLNAFPTDEDKLAVVHLLHDVEGIAKWLGTRPGVVAGALASYGQERLDEVKTKSEMGKLVVDLLIADHDRERAYAALDSTDAMFDVPPPADLRLFSKVVDVMKQLDAAHQAEGPLVYLPGNGTVH